MLCFPVVWTLDLSPVFCHTKHPKDSAKDTDPNVDLEGGDTKRRKKRGRIVLHDPEGLRDVVELLYEKVLVEKYTSIQLDLGAEHLSHSD